MAGNYHYSTCAMFNYPYGQQNGHCDCDAPEEDQYFYVDDDPKDIEIGRRFFREFGPVPYKKNKRVY